MPNVPTPALSAEDSAATRMALAELKASWYGWLFEYAAGEAQPWRANRAEGDTMNRPGAITAIRAVTPEVLGDLLRASEWIDAKDQGR